MYKNKITDKKNHFTVLYDILPFKQDIDGQIAPKGAIHGFDGQSQFVCMDYRVKGKYGFTKGGLPYLEIYRPCGNKWQREIEHNLTTKLIYKIYFMNEDACEIDWQIDYAAFARSCVRERKVAEYVPHTTNFGTTKPSARTSLEYTFDKNGNYVSAGEDLSCTRTLADISKEQGGNLHERFAGNERKSVYDILPHR